MAVTVNLNPNVSNYIIGDAPITVSMSGGNAYGPAYYWESNSGLFADPYAATTTFVPENATKTVTIIGRRTENTFGSVVGNQIGYGTRGFQKTSGTAWTDAYANTNNALSSSSFSGFFQFQVRETSGEKAGGFLDNGANADPNSAGFLFAWHLMANGLAIPKKQGVAIANYITYRANDIFRVQADGSRVMYYHNGTLIATTSITGSSLYGFASIRSVGGIIDNPVFLIDPLSNEGLKTVGVTGLFPVEPNYSYELNSDVNTLSSTAEDGSAIFRKKGAVKKTLSLQFVERPYSEYLQIQKFWEAHERHEKFVYRDIIFDDSYVMRFDAGIKLNILGADTITIVATLKEA